MESEKKVHVVLSLNVTFRCIGDAISRQCKAIHCSRMYCQSEQYNIDVMSQPSKSPGIDPTDNIWNELKQHVRCRPQKKSRFVILYFASLQWHYATFLYIGITPQFLIVALRHISLYWHYSTVPYSGITPVFYSSITPQTAFDRNEEIQHFVNDSFIIM